MSSNLYSANNPQSGLIYSEALEISAPPLGGTQIQKPDVLTPEVMVFFGFLAFLAVFGRRGGM